MDEPRQDQIKEAVRAHYAARARELSPCCCGAESPVRADQGTCCSPATTGISLGCGDLMAFCEIQEGQVVLDLGSGLGMDVILAAQRVGHTGKVIGLDMTPEMIDGAKRHARQAGVGEITDFRLGEMEDMPVADGSVDWVISNCVVNLSPDKEKVFQEAYRVLRPGGQMLVSDLVSSGLPEELRRNLASWTGCVGGTVEEGEYLRLIEKAGFDEVAVVDKVDATAAMLGTGCCGGGSEGQSGLRIDSVKVRAVKRTHT
jgi:arsenite methyltransferase